MLAYQKKGTITSMYIVGWVYRPCCHSHGSSVSVMRGAVQATVAKAGRFGCTGYDAAVGCTGYDAVVDCTGYDAVVGCTGYYAAVGRTGYGSSVAT